VLVIDDNQDMVLTLSTLLELEGHEVKGIYSALSVVTDVREFSPHVIVMDITMPGRSGWDAAKEIRRIVKSDPPMLIAVSGSQASTLSSAELKESGFDHFLSKPVEAKQVLELISAHAKGRSQKGGS
jgi:CheY-like chemotaxis protein